MAASADHSADAGAPDVSLPLCPRCRRLFAMRDKAPQGSRELAVQILRSWDRRFEDEEDLLERLLTGRLQRADA